MKANEAPEKIYLRHNHKGDIGAGWLIFPLTNNDIEYTRTDAFIKKACEWLMENVEKHISADGEYTVYYEEMFEDFRNYMKGE